MTKAGAGNSSPSPATRNQKLSLQLLEKLTSRTGNVDTARNAALAIFHALDDARSLAALGTIRALARVHHFLTVRCFCNLSTYCHVSFLLTCSILRSPISFTSRADNCVRNVSKSLNPRPASLKKLVPHPDVRSSPILQ